MFSISYGNKLPINSDTWDGQAYSISIFENNEFTDIDNSNIVISLLRIANYIKRAKVLNNDVDLLAIARFVYVAWMFILSVYKGR